MPTPLHHYYSRAACDRVKETPPEQNIWQQGCAALCVTQLLTPPHAFRNDLPSFLTPSWCGNRHSSDTSHQIGHPHVFHKRRQTSLCQYFRDFKPGLPHFLWIEKRRLTTGSRPTDSKHTAPVQECKSLVCSDATLQLQLVLKKEISLKLVLNGKGATAASRSSIHPSTLLEGCSFTLISTAILHSCSHVYHQRCQPNCEVIHSITTSSIQLQVHNWK